MMYTQEKGNTAGKVSKPVNEQKQRNIFPELPVLNFGVLYSAGKNFHSTYNGGK